MLRTTFLTATCALLLAGPALAQTATPSAPAETEMSVTTKEVFTAPAGTDATTVGSIQPKDGQILATSFIGESVYESEKADAATVGKVNDLIFTPDGKIEAAVVGVGGFLGVGEKDVAVSPSKLKMATRSDGKTWLVTTATKDELNAAPAFDRSKLADAASGTTGAGSGAPAAPAPAPAQ
ncbi:PRC-barrel domain-containing protein [Mesorhizobium retamae]|uniref:PRC-barrel domain-containing protein n=1 Tax=Mesorhizobium retamae TaxID=2912854 RepID=A0ABS9QLB0_9HYPH|nr:PRC-barrel domain-containing protein [Mesorhizobium sp. IRAMC:0171]MCG7508234.1 PRC-barrel domain-containing protein [Mesorhizobium sp. IRAMC:0171]